MNVPVRLPRIAAAGVAVVVESVAVAAGASVRAGDLLMVLRAGAGRLRFHSEVSGTVRDLRAQAGDQLMAERVVLWMESLEPPPIKPVAAFPGVEDEADDPQRIAFHLPAGLLAPRPPAVSKIAVRAGDSLQAGVVCFEVALGPVRFDWCAPVGGVVAEVLVREGQDLGDGRAVLKLANPSDPSRPEARSEPPASLPKASRRREVPEMTLAEFRQSTRALRELVGEMTELVSVAGLRNSTILLRAEMANLADPRFSVAVMGEFKRGKSTFLNALAGGRFLPSDVTPCTAFACRFQYAQDLQLALIGLDGSEKRAPQTTMPEIAAELDRLTRDPNTEIREAIIRLPLGLCRDGVDLIDTPGLNDSEAMNRVALSILPNADAAFLLLIPESPLSDTERSFLADHLLGRDLGRVMFVLNAKDRVPEQKLGRLVDYLQGEIDRILAVRQQAETAHSQLFCVSARDELEHPGDEQAGFTELRRELHRLLFRQRGRLTLTQALQRIGRAANEATASAKLRLAQRATSRESFLASLEEMERQLGVTRLNAGEMRRRIHEAQTRVESAVAEEARNLHLALLGLCESLPREIEAEWIRKSTKEEVKQRLTAMLQHHSGRLYQQALGKLLEVVRGVYEPLSGAVSAFVEQAHGAFVAFAGSLYRQAVGAQAVAQRETMELAGPREADFRGTFAVRIDLSLGALSWLFLVESARSVLSTGEIAASLEARAVAALRENYTREIERQVRLKAGEQVLSTRLGEVARSPFDQLLHRLDQEMAVLVDDSNAILASLRTSAPSRQESDQTRHWQELLDRIESLLTACEEAVCKAPEEPVAVAS